MKKIASLAVGAATLIFSAQAGASFHDGVKCYQNGDIECATREFYPEADDGNMAAQYLLGMIYLNELAPVKDNKGAEFWLLRAAKAGNVSAQNELARMYRDGDGVSQDTRAMKKWYRQAAENGDVGAQLMLADTLAWGDPKKPQYEEAYMWYTVAIDYWGTHAERARDAIKEELTLKQSRRAVDRARTWLKERDDK